MCAAAVIGAATARAGEPPGTDAPAFQHALATNAVKPFLGIAGLEYEFLLEPRVSLRVSAEYLFQNVTGMQHPDAVALIGSRLHLWRPSSASFPAGLTLGLHAGTTYTRAPAAPDPQQGWFSGAELGYRVGLGRRFFLLPRVIASYGFTDQRLTPGAEAMVGALF